MVGSDEVWRNVGPFVEGVGESECAIAKSVWDDAIEVAQGRPFGGSCFIGAHAIADGGDEGVFGRVTFGRPRAGVVGSVDADDAGGSAIAFEANAFPLAEEEAGLGRSFLVDFDLSVEHDDVRFCGGSGVDAEYGAEVDDAVVVGFDEEAFAAFADVSGDASRAEADFHGGDEVDLCGAVDGERDAGGETDFEGALGPEEVGFSEAAPRFPWGVGVV